MQLNDQPIENRFGEAVLEGRQTLGISQKTLASRLLQRGLALDASAISRIEKGTRAIRLSEAALIANTLGFTLSDVEQALDPKDDFERRREGVDHALFAALQACIEAADEVDGLAWLAERHPDVLEILGIGNQEPAPRDAKALVEWLERDWRERPNTVHRHIGTRYPNSELRDAALSLLLAVASSAVDKAVGEDPHV